MPPSHKTIKRAVRAVDAAAADEQLCAWLRAEAAAGRLNWRHIAIDGKTVRGAVRSRIAKIGNKQGQIFIP